MISLNLANRLTSDIEYKILQFPDGQQDIIIDQLVGRKDAIEIESRFNSFKDLELIICANKALKRMGVQRIGLSIPYLLGARSDRQFVAGGNSYLVDIIAPILNAQLFDHIDVFDAHSDVAAACINNFFSQSNHVLVKETLVKWGYWGNIVDGTSVKYGFDINKFVLVAPDAGASKKVYDLANRLNYTGDIIIAGKHRDVVSGQVVSTYVPLVAGEHNNKDFIIIDDICDGGRTFTELAKKIKEMRPNAVVKLIVSHGLFSAGPDALFPTIDAIATTNSIRDYNGPNVYTYQLL